MRISIAGCASRSRARAVLLFHGLGFFGVKPAEKAET